MDRPAAHFPKYQDTNNHTTNNTDMNNTNTNGQDTNGQDTNGQDTNNQDTNNQDTNNYTTNNHTTNNTNMNNTNTNNQDTNNTNTNNQDTNNQDTNHHTTNNTDMNNTNTDGQNTNNQDKNNQDTNNQDTNNQDTNNQDTNNHTTNNTDMNENNMNHNIDATNNNTNDNTNDTNMNDTHHIHPSPLQGTAEAFDLEVPQHQDQPQPQHQDQSQPQHQDQPQPQHQDQPQPQHQDQPQPAEPHNTDTRFMRPAGILFSCCGLQGARYFLLGVESRDHWTPKNQCCCFWGNASRSDTSTFMTAAREAAEETLEIFGNSAQLEAYLHDRDWHRQLSGSLFFLSLGRLSPAQRQTVVQRFQQVRSRELRLGNAPREMLEIQELVWVQASELMRACCTDESQGWFVDVNNQNWVARSFFSRAIARACFHTPNSWLARYCSGEHLSVPRPVYLPWLR